MASRIQGIIVEISGDAYLSAKDNPAIFQDTGGEHAIACTPGSCAI